MKGLILMLINFMDAMHIPENIEHDPKRIQEIVNSAWQIAIKSKPAEEMDSRSCSNER